MNAQTKMSAKGQVVIPRDVRKRLGLAPGCQFDVIETDSGVLLRKQAGPAKLTHEEAVARIRRAVERSGIDVTKPLTDDPIGDHIRRKWGDHRGELRALR